MNQVWRWGASLNSMHILDINGYLWYLPKNLEMWIYAECLDDETMEKAS